MKEQSKENHTKQHKKGNSQELQVFSNADDVKVENIPPAVLDEMAELFYNVFSRIEAEKTADNTTEE